MKNTLPGYHFRSEEEIKEFWDIGIIIFDTNAYLDLYRYSEETRNEILELFDLLIGRLWMPHHICYEYLKNRYDVIYQQKRIYLDSKGKYESFLKDAISSIHHPILSKEIQDNLKSNFESAIDEFNKSAEQYDSFSKKDPVYEKLLSIYDGKVGDEYTKEQIEAIKKEGKVRYADKIPPGYKDANKENGNEYGDLIIWKQILDFAKTEKKPIIFVTGDQKSDWIWIINEKKTLGARPELVNEIFNESGMKLLMYSNERFIEKSKHYLKSEIQDSSLNEIKLNKFEKTFYDIFSSQLAKLGGLEHHSITEINKQLGKLYVNYEIIKRKLATLNSVEQIYLDRGEPFDMENRTLKESLLNEYANTSKLIESLELKLKFAEEFEKLSIEIDQISQA